MVLQKQLISPQYLNKSQITVTILHVLSPVHFVVKETPSLDGSFEAKNFIEAEEAMQKYYESVEPCFFQLPLKDTIIVVYFKDKFYRAKVIGILTLSAGHLFKVYLVDYGLECSVERECIYQIAKDFLEHPFQAANFKLIGIEPIGLVMNDKNLNMSYGPVSDWDPSAEKFVHELQKEMCNAYIEIQTTDEKYIYGKLFICYGNDIIKCVNDELVSNNFAHFNESSLENAQNVEKSVGNANSGSSISRTPESSKLQKSTSKQISSPSSSDLDLDFRMTFVSPEGKIVAESSFTECSTTEDNLQSKYVSSSDGKIVAESSVTEFSKAEDNLQSESIAQKKFLRLQQLHKKKLRSPISPSNDVCSTGKNLPTAERTTDVKMSPSNDSSVKIKHLDNSSSKDYKVNSETFSTPKSSVSSTIISSNLIENPCVDLNQATSKMSPGINETEERLITQKRFEKLQQMARNKFKSPILEDSTCIKSTRIGTEIAANMTSVSIKSTENQCDISLKSLSSDSRGTFQPNVTKSYVEVPTESSPKQENVSEDQLIAQKRFEKLQQMARHKLKSPILADSTCIKSTPIGTIGTEIAANMTSVSIESTENQCDISLNSLSSDSPGTFHPNVTKSYVEIPTESSPKKENISEDQLIAQKRFEKLQQMARHKIKSPILADSTCIKSSPTGKEIAANMTSVSIESNENQCDISLKSLSSDSPETFQPSVAKNCVEVPTESSSKQENNSEVVLEHVNTLQRLRNRVRRKLLDSPLPLTDKSSDVNQICADTDKMQTSSSSILSNSLGQI